MNAAGCPIFAATHGSAAKQLHISPLCRITRELSRIFLSDFLLVEGSHPRAAASVAEITQMLADMGG